MKNQLFRTILVLSMMAVMFSVTAQPVSADAPAPDQQNAKFEISFMEGMITHHAGAIKEGQKYLEQADHPELLNTCQNIIVIQSQEIDAMQTWLCEWYGICSYRKNL
jgi:uncharacterized protein (DUF305 family)